MCFPERYPEASPTALAAHDDRRPAPLSLTYGLWSVISWRSVAQSRADPEPLSGNPNTSN
jgi:hypothetical protein